MMQLSPSYKRRVRIEGGTDDLAGYRLTIRDVETGEVITNVRRAIIYLSASQENRVQLTYLPVNDQGRHILRNGKPVEEQVELDAPDISLTAFEKFPRSDEEIV